MNGADDDMIVHIYDAVKVICIDRLRDDHNPNLAPVSFNQMRPPTLTHILVHLTGLQKADTNHINHVLRDFPFGKAELVGEEDERGKMQWWIEVEIPRETRRHKHKHHQHHGYDKYGKRPSCTRLLVSATIFMGLLLTTVMTTNLPQLLVQ